MKQITYWIAFIVVVIFIGISISYFYVPENTVMYKQEYDLDTKVLDFTEKELESFDELVNKIKMFDNLEKVKFKDGTLTVYQKNVLQKLYPNVEIETISYVNFYDKVIREDVEELDLSNMILDSGIVDKLEDLKELKLIKLYNTNLSIDDKINLIDKYPNIKYEWDVILNGNTYGYETESLNFNSITIENKEEFTKSLKLLYNLKTLDMSYTNFSNEELGNMRALYPNVEIDWVVQLKRWSIKTSDTSFSVLITAFDYEPIVSEDLYVLKYCTKLRALDLGHQKITDISMIPEYLPELRVLILADNKITDISALSKLEHLHYLELFINQITDISALADLKELVDINLCYNNKLGDISPLYELPYLERIWLVNVPARHQMEELQNRFPNARIEWYGPGSTDQGWRQHERYYAMIKMYRNRTLPVNDVFLKYDNIGK